MLKAENKISKMKKIIINILKKHNVKKVGIFGSYARGDEKKNSDIDILIDVDGTLLDVIKIEIELKKKLKKNVDLLTYGGINHLLKKNIPDEEVRII